MAEGEGRNPLLDPKEQAVVDASFQKLFGYAWGTTFRLDGELSEEERLLCGMLGSAAAARISTSTGRRNLRLLVTKEDRPRFRAKPAIHRKSQRSVKHPAPKAQASATNNAASSSATADAKPAAAPVRGAAPGGVSQLLQTINASGKISTIAKSAADWDQFKDKTGLGDKLEEQATSNTAYLNKKDFLDRVDHRTFEVEKKERDRERQKRGA